MRYPLAARFADFFRGTLRALPSRRFNEATSRVSRMMVSTAIFEEHPRQYGDGTPSHLIHRSAMIHLLTSPSTDQKQLRHSFYRNPFTFRLQSGRWVPPYIRLNLGVSLISSIQPAGPARQGLYMSRLQAPGCRMPCFDITQKMRLPLVPRARVNRGNQVFGASPMTAGGVPLIGNPAAACGWSG